MKKVILSIIVLSFLFGGIPTGILSGSYGVKVFAKEAELPDPGLTPDSPFYFLERIAEKIGTFFTFGHLKKAERHATLAAERLAEIQAMAEKASFDKTQDKKLELIEKSLKRYEDQLVKASLRIEKAKTKGKDTQEVVKVINEATDKYFTILEKVLEKMPEQAKPAIERAMIVSTKEGLEKAVEALKQRDVSGQNYEVLKAKCLESGAPPEVCASIDEALQSSKPLRTLCLEQGGTQEMCQELPLENFESFEQIKGFCLETGGPPEICASLEGKCRELGITTADKCLRVLSISSVTTFQATSPTASPARSLSEEEMKERRIGEEGNRTIKLQTPGGTIEVPVEELEERRYIETLRVEPEEKEFSSGQLEALAKCLVEKGVKFYGSENCSYCKKQKEMFGDAMRFLPYIECADEGIRYLCEEANIKGFPTWDFPSKERAMGLQSLEQLLKLSGCSL